MATINSLKRALRQRALGLAPLEKQPLSETQYGAGLDILVPRDAGSTGSNTYRDFIIPQLSELLSPLFLSNIHISALEIGPGPRSILGFLSSDERRKITRYAAFEPNGLFASSLVEWLGAESENEPPLPCLECPPDIRRSPFTPDTGHKGKELGGASDTGQAKFNLILFCHSMYGMKPKSDLVRGALAMLADPPRESLVVVFHRGDALEHLDGLVCQRTASIPTGIARVSDDDETLDRFARLIAGFSTEDEAVKAEWRSVCRGLGRREDGAGSVRGCHLLFSDPNVMAAFSTQATALLELATEAPLLLNERDKTFKNAQASLRRPAAIMRPREVRHVQMCVQWALRNKVGLTVVGGGHGGHCVRPNVVAVDMSAFDRVQVILADAEEGPLVVAEAGCQTGDIIREAMAAGLTVPLGARPSVGAGLWLQGGIGHLARLHGLACDAIVGALVISVDSGEVLNLGCMPSQCRYRPAGATPQREVEADLLWTMKGAGTNFGIVVSVAFKAQVAPRYSVRDWVFPLSNRLEAQAKLGEFDKSVARELPRTSSADAYLYWNSDRLHLGVTMFETSAAPGASSEARTLTPTTVPATWEPRASSISKEVDGVAVFDAELYMHGMHGGHGGGKTSSFKRCLFLKDIGESRTIDVLAAAVENIPTPLCYLHLLQGGGAIRDVAAESTAFGCRDWDFACVVTGVWPRSQDGTETAAAAVRWVYRVAGELLPLSSGVYGADLGPDPRDAALAARAFGPNLVRLAYLKHRLDPRNVLAHACPVPKYRAPELIFLVTGETGAGKDFCAGI